MRARATAAALVVSATLLGVAGTARTAAAAELSPAADRAFAEITHCADTSDALLVSMVVDESLSLKDTDPGNQRVRGLLTAIDSLSQVRASSSGGLDLLANLSTFAAGYQTLVPWGSLDTTHAQRLRDAAEKELPGRNTGRATDYRAALLGAQGNLERRAAELSGPSCKVVLWFTDGKLDVEDATELARRELCTVRGIVDGLRADGVAIVALALLTDSGAGSVVPEERERLRAVAEGVGGGASCGTSPIPSGRASGAYLRADSPEALQRLFAGIGTRIDGGSDGDSAQCPQVNCPGGRVSVPVDSGISAVRLIVTAEPGTRLSLESPYGQRSELDAGSMSASGADVEVRERDGVTTVDLAFASSDGAHVGTWSLAPQDAIGNGAIADVDAYYFWGTRLVLSADELTIGQESAVNVSVLDRSGQPFAPSRYEAFEVTGTVDGQRVDFQRSGDGYTATVTLPSQDAATSAVVEVSATATTSPSGIALGPLTAVERVAPRLPPSFPSFRPSRLDLPRLEGTGQTSGVLHIEGSDRGQTRACLQGQDISAPDGTGAVSVVADARCIDVPASGSVDWTFAASAEHARDGRVEGVLRVLLTGADGADTKQVAVPIGFSITRPVDEPLRWMVVATLMGLALLIPLALIWGANAATARYRLTPSSRVARVPVRLGPTGLSRRSTGHAGPLIVPENFSGLGLGLAGASSRPTFTAAGVTFHRKLAWWPMRAPQALARSNAGLLCLSGIGRYTTRPGTAPVSFGLADSWVVVVSPAAVSADGADAELVFVDDDRIGLKNVIEARSDRLGAFLGWPALWALVLEQATSRTPPGPSVPGASAAAEAGGGDSPPPPRGPLDDPGRDDPPPPPRPESSAAGRGAGVPPPRTSTRDSYADVTPRALNQALPPLDFDPPPPPRP